MPLTVTFAQGHNWLKCDNFLTGTVIVISQKDFFLVYGIQAWHGGRVMHNMLMLVSMTLTLMQGHSGPAEENKFSVELFRQLSK